MSSTARFETFLDDVDTALRSAVQAVTTLPAGTDGIERMLRDGENLPQEQYPHVFMFGLTMAVEDLDFRQKQETLSVTVQLWHKPGATRENMLADIDHIANELETTDPSILVELYTWSMALVAVNAPKDDTEYRVAEMTITAVGIR